MAVTRYRGTQTATEARRSTAPASLAEYGVAEASVSGALTVAGESTLVGRAQIGGAGDWGASSGAGLFVTSIATPPTDPIAGGMLVYAVSGAPRIRGSSMGQISLGGVADVRTADSGSASTAIGFTGNSLLLGAGEVWFVEAVAHLTNSSTVDGVNVGVNVPSGTAVEGVAFGAVTATTFQELPLSLAAGAGTSATAAGGWCKLSGTKTQIRLTLRLATGASGGNFNCFIIAAAANTASAKVGSYIRAWRLT